MKREVEEDEEEFEQQKQRRLERIRDDLLSKLREYGQGGIFMEIVKYLSIEDAYALSKLDEEINMYFHKHGVWEEYAQDYLWRYFHKKLEDVLREYFTVYPRTPVNYLWILLCYDTLIMSFSTEPRGVFFNFAGTPPDASPDLYMGLDLRTRKSPYWNTILGFRQIFGPILNAC
jgi:hypothetical protein